MIAQLITDKLNESRKDFAFQITDGKWGDWTHLLKVVIAKIAAEMPESLKNEYSNLLTCAEGQSEYFDEGEWLYDLVWYEMDENVDVSDGMNVMKSIPLVLESEMSDKTWKGFKIDFDKLLVATASTRIFVTRIKDETNEQNRLSKKLDYAKKAVNSFDYVDIVYIIVWNENEMHSSEPFKLYEICKSK